MPALLDRPIPALQAAGRGPNLDRGSRRMEHLTDYAFRLGAGLPPSRVPLPRPAAGERWTLAQTLQEIRRRRASIQVTTNGLRVRHAHLLGDLAAAVRQHQDDVRLWLNLGRPVPRGGWDDEVELHLRWLDDRFSPGRDPVALRPGVSITDWPRFVASVADRAAAGPGAPCAAGLRRDLADLFERHADLGTQFHVERLPARAA